MKRAAALILALSPGLAAAEKMACYEEPGTLRYTCIDEHAVRVNGDLRASPLWSGGRNGVRPTPYQFLVNCRSNVVTMQDRDGVNFAGALASDSPAARNLARWVCEAAKPRKDPKLRQF